MRCLATAVVVCALVVGCGGGGNEFPTGSWTARLPPTADSPAARVLAEYRADGIWRFSFRKSNDWTEASSGAYSTTEDTIRFETDAYCKSTRPHVEQATYSWALDDRGRLILTAQYDPCPGRVEALDGVVYSPVEPPPGV